MDTVSMNHYSITSLLGAGTFGDAFTASVSTDLASFSSLRCSDNKNLNNAASNNDTVTLDIPEPRRYTQAVIKRSLVVPLEMMDRNDNRLNVEVTGNGTLTGPFSESREVAMSKLLGFKYNSRNVIENEREFQTLDRVNTSVLASAIPSVSNLPNQRLENLFNLMVPLPIIPTLHEAFFAYDTTVEQAPQENSNSLVTRSSIIQQAVQNRKGNISLLQVSEPFGRDLWSWVTKSPSKLANDALRRTIIRQIFVLLARMHQQNLIHRDIKLANILLEFTNDQEPLVRFCDMGCVRPAPDTSKGEFATPYVCSRYYRAPELLCGSSQYSTSVDIWATATSLIEMYMQLDALLDGSVAAEISLGRGNGNDDIDPNDPQTMSRRRCVLFPGVATDGHQLIHIFNLLGVPNADDIEGLRVPDWSEAWLRRMGRYINTCASLEAANRYDLLDRYSSFATQVHHRLDTEPINKLPSTGPNASAPRRSSNTARGFFAPVAYPPDAAPVNTNNESKFYMCKLAPDVDSRHDPDMAKAFTMINPVHVGPLDMVQFLIERFIPPDLADLFSCMLHWDPRKRMTAEEALFHPALLQLPYIPKPIQTKLNGMVQSTIATGGTTTSNEGDNTVTPSKSTFTSNDTGNTSQFVPPLLLSNGPTTNTTTTSSSKDPNRTIHPLTTGLMNTSAPYARYTVNNTATSSHMITSSTMMLPSTNPYSAFFMHNVNHPTNSSNGPDPGVVNLNNSLKIMNSNMVVDNGSSNVLNTTMMNTSGASI